MPTQRRWRRSARNCCPVARPPGCPRTWPRARAALRLMRNWPRSPPCFTGPPRRRCRTHSPRGSRPRWPPRPRPGPWTLPTLAAAAAGAGAATPGTPGRGGSQGPAGQDRTREQTGRRAGWRGHDRSWLALRVAAVTAAVAVIAGGGYGVAQLLTGSPAVNGTASRAAPGGAAPNIRVTGPVPRMSAGGFNSAPGSGTGGSARYLRAPGDQQRHELPVRNPGRPSQLCPRKSEPPCPLKRAPRTHPGPLAKPGEPLPRPASLPDPHRQRPAPPASGPSQVPRPPSPSRRTPVRQRRQTRSAGHSPRLHRHHGPGPSHGHPSPLRLGPAPNHLPLSSHP